MVKGNTLKTTEMYTLNGCIIMACELYLNKTFKKGCYVYFILSLKKKKVADRRNCSSTHGNYLS